MTSLNKKNLIGYLGSDPELHHLPDGTATVTLSLATTEKWKDKVTGQIKESTEWHRLVFYKNLAETVNKYLKKGALIFVEGRLHTNKWTDKKNQVERYTTEIVVKEMKMFGNKKPHAQEESDLQQISSSIQENEVYDIPF